MEEAELAKAQLELARAKLELGHPLPEFLSAVTDESGRRIQLQRMSLEELQAVPFVPGKTIEEIQAEMGKGRNSKPNTSKSYHKTHHLEHQSAIHAPDTLMDDTLAPGEFDPQDVVHVQTRPYTKADKRTHVEQQPAQSELFTVYSNDQRKPHKESHHGHQHKHKHGESCSHDHGHSHSDHSHGDSGIIRKGADRSTKMQVNRYRNWLRALIIFIQCTHYGFEIFYIAPRFSNPFATWLVQVLVAILWFFTTYSHLQVSLTPSKAFRRVKDVENLEPKDTEYKTCEKCTEPSWKPPRAKHCSVQGHDVLRFDHYCPVTLNTVGYRTHGAFLVTAYCHMIGGITWGILLPIYILTNWKDLMPKTLGRIMIALVMILLDYFMILSIMGMACGISFSHIGLVLNHGTTLEGGNNFGIWAKDRKKGSHNWTILYNLRQYFTNDWWCFGLQGRYEGNKYEGYYYPRVGETREKLSFSASEDNSNNVNGTRLEVPPEGIEMIGRMLYENYLMSYPNYVPPTLGTSTSPKDVEEEL